MCGSWARGRVGARGGTRGRGLSPGQGTFSENQRPARASGDVPAPLGAGGSQQSCSRGSGRTWRRAGFVVFLPPAGRPSGSPAPSRGFKPPARTPVQVAREGPGPQVREVQLSPPAGAPAPGSPWPRDDPAARTAAPAQARGDGRFPGRAGCGRPSSRGSEGRLANFAELSPLSGRGRPAARAAPAPPAEGGRGSPCAPSPPAGRRLARRPGSPRRFAPCGRRGCCLPGRWVALRSGWSCGSRSLRAVAH